MKNLVLSLMTVLFLLAAATVRGETVPPTAEPTAGPTTEKVDALIQADQAAPVEPQTQPQETGLTAKETRLIQKPKDNYKIETLIDSDIYAHGGYGAVGNKITTIDGKVGYMVGGRGAWIVNHSFLLGGGGYGLVHPSIKREFNGEMKRLEFGYGGIELGYVCHADRVLHLSIQSLVGAGGIGYVDEKIIGVDEYGDDIIKYEGERDAFFVLEPMLYAELNVTQWFRICLGAGYRYVAGVQLKGVTDQELRGANGELLFKFGTF